MDQGLNRVSLLCDALVLELELVRAGANAFGEGNVRGMLATTDGGGPGNALPSVEEVRQEIGRRNEALSGGKEGSRGPSLRLVVIHPPDSEAPADQRCDVLAPAAIADTLQWARRKSIWDHWWGYLSFHSVAGGAALLPSGGARDGVVVALAVLMPSLEPTLTTSGRSPRQLGRDWGSLVSWCGLLLAERALSGSSNHATLAQQPPDWPGVLQRTPNPHAARTVQQLVAHVEEAVKFVVAGGRVANAYRYGGLWDVIFQLEEIQLLLISSVERAIRAIANGAATLEDAPIDRRQRLTAVASHISATVAREVGGLTEAVKMHQAAMRLFDPPTVDELSGRTARAKAATVNSDDEEDDDSGPNSSESDSETGLPAEVVDKVLEGDAPLLGNEEDVALSTLAESESSPRIKPRRQVKYLSDSDGYEVVNNSGLFFDEERGFIGDDFMHVSAVFIKNALPLSLCGTAASGLAKAATKQNMRILTNGGDEPPDTGIVGYYDYSTTPQTLKCRETSYTRKNFSLVASTCTEFMKALDLVYKKNAPLHHKLQKTAAPPEYQLFGTAFSTLTVNKNFRTAAHTDQGDFKAGFGVVAVLAGEFSGCHLAIPKLKKAFNIRPGDVLLFDTSLEHGNTEVRSPDLCWERISIVAYLRTKLLSTLCEQERNMRRLRKLRRPLDAFGSSGAAGRDVVDLRELFAVRHQSLSLAASQQRQGSPIFIPRRLLRFLTPTQVSALLFAGARLSARPLRRSATPDQPVVGGGRLADDKGDPHEVGGGCVIGLPMGHGKTLLALVLAFSHLHEYPTDDVLIVTPKSVLPHWRAEAVKWCSKSGLFFRSFISRDEGDVAWELALMYYNQQTVTGEIAKVGHVFVINAESLGTLHARCPSLVPSLILVDEGHKVGTGGSESQLVQTLMRMSLDGSGGSSLADPTSRRRLAPGGSNLATSNSLTGFGSSSRRVVFTGTPLQNSASEIYTLVEFICPVIYRILPRSIFNQKVEAIERYVRYISARDIARTKQAHTAAPLAVGNTGHEVGSPVGSSSNPEVLSDGDEEVVGTCSVIPPGTSTNHREGPVAVSRSLKEMAAAVDSQTFLLNWMQSFVFRDHSFGFVGAESVGRSASSPSKRGKGDAVEAAALLPTYDYVVVCGSSRSQADLFDMCGLSGNLNAAQNVLRATEHRPFHISAHPLAYYCFMRHREGGRSGSHRQRATAAEDDEGAFIAEDDFHAAVTKPGLKRERELSTNSAGTVELSQGEVNFMSGYVGATLGIDDVESALTEGSSLTSLPLAEDGGDMLEFITMSGKLSVCVAVVLRAVRSQLHSGVVDKVIVFSQYTQIQRLLVSTLEGIGVPCVYLSGGDSTAARRDAVDRFRGTGVPAAANPPVVMVASTKAAAFGLDLTVANHVVMFDSWWNPQLDAQAIARVKRTNQTKPVFVYRLASEYEDAILLSAHRKKIAIFDCVINAKPIRDIFDGDSGGGSGTTPAARDSVDALTLAFLDSLRAHEALSTRPLLEGTNASTVTNPQTAGLAPPAAVVAVFTYSSLTNLESQN